MKRLLGWTALLGLLVPVAVAGQTTWDAPSLMRPGSPAGTTVALTQNGPGDHLGVLALWRKSPAPIGIGIRGEIVNEPRNDVMGLVGLDISGPLGTLHGAGDPRALWWTGAGLGIGHRLSAAVPLGLAFGWTLPDQNVSFMPYVGAHAVLVVRSGAADQASLDGVFDVGLDLELAPAWTVRFAAALGGRQALAIGLVLPTR